MFVCLFYLDYISLEKYLWKCPEHLQGFWMHLCFLAFREIPVLEMTWFLGAASQEVQLSGDLCCELGCLTELPLQSRTAASPCASLAEGLFHPGRGSWTLPSLHWRVLAWNEFEGSLWCNPSYLQGRNQHTSTALVAGFCWEPGIYKFPILSVAQVKHLPHWNVWTFNCIHKLL